MTDYKKTLQLANLLKSADTDIFLSVEIKNDETGWSEVFSFKSQDSTQYQVLVDRYGGTKYREVKQSC